MKNKKGAMFGLDARIALAIFGALSVISGAALYSAIKNAQTEQLRQYFENIIKASEQYYLDNGKPLPYMVSHSADLMYLSDLSENRESLKTWKGPYINSEEYGGFALKDSITRKIEVNVITAGYLKKTSVWVSNTSNNSESCSNHSFDCAEWVALSILGAPSVEEEGKRLFKQLDELVDSGDGELNGKVRFNDHGMGLILYRGINRVETE